MAATSWTVADRLRACKDRRAKLLLSLDGGGAAAPAPPLAAHGLRLYAWHAKAPGRAVYASGTGVYACVVAKDLVLADNKQAAALREAAAAEAEAAAARLEKELAAGGKPFTAVGSAVCFAPRALEWVFAPFPPAADAHVPYSAVRRRCQALDQALCPPVHLTPALPTPFAFPSPAPTVDGGAGLGTPTIATAPAGSAIIAASPAAPTPAITKRLEAALCEVEGLETHRPSPASPAAGGACTEAEAESPRAVAAAPAPSLTSTSSCEDGAAAPAVPPEPVAEPVLREKADSFVLELCATASYPNAPAARAPAAAPTSAPIPDSAETAAAGGSPLVRLRSTERFIVLDLMPSSSGGDSTSPACSSTAADDCSDAAADAGAAAFGSPIREALLQAERPCVPSPPEAVAGTAGTAPPAADATEAQPCAAASAPTGGSRALGPWTLAALAGVSGAALVALRWRGH